MQPKTVKKLGEILVDQKFITKDQLELGVEQQKLVKKRLGEILTEMGFLTIENLGEALSSQIQKPPIDGMPAGAVAFAKTKNIGEILLDYHLITKEQLARGVEEQRKSNKRLGEALTDLGYVSEEKIARALSAQLGIPYTDLSSVVVEPEAIDLFKERVARKNMAMPLSVDKRFITVAMADPWILRPSMISTSLPIERYGLRWLPRKKLRPPSGDITISPNPWKKSSERLERIP